MNYQIEGLTLAVTRMEEMLNFYKAVFEMDFQEQEMYGHQLYRGQWESMNLLFCPAALAQNTATQNRHQFDILVDDLEKVMEIALGHGGELMAAPTDDRQFRSVGIWDPDRNSTVFKQALG